MTAEIHLPTKSLYEEDFNLWLSATAEQLRAGRFDEIDLENLIEEIQSMGRSDRRFLESYLENIIEHLLRLAYWDSERERNRNHWIHEIVTFRNSLAKILKDSPSLLPYLEENFLPIYASTAKKVKKSFKLDVPLQSPFTIEEVIDPDWFPIDIENDNQSSLES
ncbi:MAG: hypothetical protein N5P05_003282 [Chroococcopsis gigantea SAG 12.99]|jgi:hypothetical protein|nr:DUF29 domain-containing protein [Chlorogloea purpurea SAG 13.99]MDV3001676.1 hypothetical protein [Chroococcopsis gigantea SAG 12.99]